MLDGYLLTPDGAVGDSRSLRSAPSLDNGLLEGEVLPLDMSFGVPGPLVPLPEDSLVLPPPEPPLEELLPGTEGLVSVMLPVLPGDVLPEEGMPGELGA